MRIVHFFNLANDAYMIVKGLRKLGTEADVVVMKYGAATQYPHWEEVDTTMVPFRPNMTDEDYGHFMEFWTPPSWVRFIDMGTRMGLPRDVAARAKMISMMREYDLVVAHQPSSIYAMISGVPYIPFDAGFIRYMMGLSIKQILALRSYRSAPFVMYTNPDTYRIFESATLQNKIYFCPFAIDTDKYSPGTEAPSEVPTSIFSPSRQIWREKGNDIIIKAFDTYQKRFNPEAEIHLCRWGEDLALSMDLLQKLGTRNVVWHETMTKPQLISMYRKCDVVLDQFILGSYGSTAPEAMSCGKPVVISLDQELNTMAFGEMPPVVNAKSSDEIVNALSSMGKEEMLELGLRSRDWILRKHSLEAVAKVNLSAYQRLGLS